MLSDDLREAEETEAGSPGKRIVLVGALIVLLGVGTALIYALRSGRLHVPAGLHLHAMQGTQKRPAARASNLYYLEPLILNGMDSEEDATSFVRLTLTLELARPEIADQVTAHLAAVQNAVIVAAASRESRALRTAQGKALLRDELTDRINALLPNGGVTAVYFADFFIQ